MYFRVDWIRILGIGAQHDQRGKPKALTVEYALPSGLLMSGSNFSIRFMISANAGGGSSKIIAISL
jgi:hypothetical protein